MKNTNLEKLIIADLIIMILIDIFIIFIQANYWWFFPVYNLPIFITAYFFGICILKFVFTLIKKNNDKTLKAKFYLHNLFPLIIFSFISIIIIFFPLFIIPFSFIAITLFIFQIYFVNNIRQKIIIIISDLIIIPLTLFLLISTFVGSF